MSPIELYGLIFSIMFLSGFILAGYDGYIRKKLYEKGIDTYGGIHE